VQQPSTLKPQIKKFNFLIKKLKISKWVLNEKREIGTNHWKEKREEKPPKQ
jgi:hypothetical protein